MNPTHDPSGRFSTLTIRLHWLMLILFVGVFACIELRVLFAKGTPIREGLKSTHFMLGLLVFTLAWLRIAARLRAPAPAIVPAPPRWQDLAAKAMHGLLYVWMVAMPLAGWMLLSAEGKPIPFFGLELPALVGKDKALATTIKEWHELFGRIGYGLIGVHAVAALVHHVVQHDNTLVRMMPRLARRSA